MVRIECESFGFGCPDFADVFVGCEAFEGLETAAVIVGVDKVAKMRFELGMAVVMVALDGCFLDCPVHPLDLAVGPGMPDLGEPVLDAVFAAAHVEHVGDVPGGRPVGVAWREGELDAVAHWETGSGMVRLP